MFQVFYLSAEVKLSELASIMKYPTDFLGLNLLTIYLTMEAVYCSCISV